MSKILFVIVFLMISPCFAAKELDLLKAELKKSYPKLKEEDLNSAEKFETNKEKTILALYLESEIYFAHKKSKEEKWIFTEVIDREALDLVEFKTNNRFAIHQRVEGTSRSETVSTWRLEGDSFKVIGQDSKNFSGWNYGAVISSVNYLSGRMTASSSSEKQKKRSGTCKFDIKEFRDQRLSDINVGGAKEPDCKYSVMPEI